MSGVIITGPGRFRFTDEYVAKQGGPVVCQPAEVGYRRGRTDYAAIRDEANNPATAPVEVSTEEMWDMLECVPPIYVPGGFLVGECSTSDERGDVFAHYAERNGKAYARYAVRGKPETYIGRVES